MNNTAIDLRSRLASRMACSSSWRNSNRLGSPDSSSKCASRHIRSSERARSLTSRTTTVSFGAPSSVIRLTLISAGMTVPLRVCACICRLVVSARMAPVDSHNTSQNSAPAAATGRSSCFTGRPSNSRGVCAVSVASAGLANSIRPEALTTAMPSAAVVTMESSRASLAWSWLLAMRAARRSSASLNSRTSTAPSRPRLCFITKSWAPLRIAATAVSSPMAPETMMKGMSASCARTSFSAARPSNCGRL